jgi:peptidoglycan/xylan/chitin deacetylase (PgdA/CDA1 family)
MEGGTLLRAWNALGRVDTIFTDQDIPAEGGDAILMFHSIGGGGHDNLSPTVFRSLISKLNKKVNLVDLPELFETEADERRIALTFDDGYEDYYDHVVPILRDFDAPSTVFIVASTLRNESVSFYKNVDGPFMSSKQLREIADEDLVTIGNHSLTHSNLGSVRSRERLQDEIINAKQIIETDIGVSVNRFCYPYNDLTPEAASVVKRSHDWGVAGGGWEVILDTDTNPYQVPRINAARPWWLIRWQLLDRSTHLALGVKHLLKYIRW